MLETVRNNKIFRQSILWIFLWGLFHSLTMSIAKTLNPTIQTIVLVFIRNIFGSLIVLGVVVVCKKKLSYTQNPTLHILRILLGLCAMLCTYFAYRNLSLSVATSIGFTTPLISSLLAIVLLKESLTAKKIFALTVGYLGVLLIAQPKFSENGTALLVALLANLTSSLSLVCAKKLTKNESSFQVLAYYQIGSVLLAGIVFSFNQFIQEPNNYASSLGFEDNLKLFFIGVLAVTSQYCYIRSLKHAQLSFVAPFEYLRILYANIIGYYIFSEQLDIYDIIGCFSIIIASFILSKEKS